MTASAISLNASDHPITSVTIFHKDTGTAEITRTFPVSLRSEKNVVNINGISSCIDADSPRIRVLSGTPYVQVLDVCCATQPVSAKRDALVAKRAIRQQEYDRLVDTASRLHESHAHARSHTPNVHVHGISKDSLEASEASRSKAGRDVDELIQTIVQRMGTASNALETLDTQIVELEQQLSVPLESRKGDGSTVITATIIAEQECEVTLQLTYLVTGARWEPYYDLYARTEEGRPSSDVTLHHYAKITQSTGEDWRDTEITLSTSISQSLAGLSVPSLDPLRVSSKRPNPPQARLLPTTTNMTPLGQGHPLAMTPGGFHLHTSGSAITNSQPAARPNQETLGALVDAYVHVPHPDSLAHPLASTPTASRHESVQHDSVHPAPATLSSVHDRDPPHFPVAPPSLAYRVGGSEGKAVSLPSDGLTHTVQLMAMQLRAKHDYICVPRKSGAVFIRAHIKNVSEHELLAGPVSVFVDDRFIAKATLPHTSVNGTFECILGMDARLKVSYHQRSHTESLPFVTGAAKTTVYRGVATVSNQHEIDIAGLLIRDSLPVSDEAGEVEVALRKPHGLAQAKERGELATAIKTDPESKANVAVRWANVEHGIYEWVCGLRAGAEIALEAEWAITAPRDVEWAEDASMTPRT